MRAWHVEAPGPVTGHPLWIHGQDGLGDVGRPPSPVAPVAEAAPELLRQLKAGGYKVVFLKAKSQLQTIASYDEIIGKNNKLPTLNDHPTSSVVRTIPD